MLKVWAVCDFICSYSSVYSFEGYVEIWMQVTAFILAQQNVFNLDN